VLTQRRYRPLSIGIRRANSKESGRLGSARWGEFGSKPWRDYLIEPNRRVEVLQPGVTEIAEFDAGERGPLVLQEGDRRLRDKNLSAVPGRANPRSAVHREPNVSLVGELDRPRVDPHADAKLRGPGPALGAKCLLRRHRRQHRVAWPGEGGEERVSLRVDYAALVIDECIPLEITLPRLDCRILLPELAAESCGTLDVAEEEGQGAAGRLGHGAILA
jgi:hypothetical protein